MPHRAASPSILLVGGGNMGLALLDGWLQQGTPASSITVVEPAEASAAQAARRGARVVPDPSLLGPSTAPEVVVLAVKPQVIDAILPLYAPLAERGAAILSIAAGKTTSALNRGLGGRAAVVRAMPNTPAAIRLGITVAFATTLVSDAQRASCDALLACVGSVLWIDDERLMDAVTAVSGSGPAYVFLLAECLGRAGVEAGLPEETAARLARETVAGAGALLARCEQSVEVLRANVTSPGGTTAAALSILSAADGLQPLLTRAVAAAAKRAGELAG
jgi:pyrroline-5-carboxylate reductase